MSLALEYGVEPKNMALGALAGLISILRQPQTHQLPDSLRHPDIGPIPQSGLRDLLQWVWRGRMPDRNDPVFKCVFEVQGRLMGLLGP
jgi:hypothetical protein